MTSYPFSAGCASESAAANSHRGTCEEPALLILEDGSVYEGEAYGARGYRLGEVVFTTGMTGYQETLTDPSYAGQIVVQTTPHIGNTGVNSTDMESRRVWVDGYVVRDPARRASNWRSEQTLDDLLVSSEVIGISGVDTRAITRRLRDQGSMRGGIFSGPALIDSRVEDLLTQVRSAPAMEGASFVDRVTIPQPVVLEPDGETIGSVAAVDLGIKASTPRHMLERGLRVHLLPADTTFEDIQALDVDAVFFSNGPGDPATADHQVEVLRQVLDAGIPYFGICFGNQILGRALGFGTYKLRFGHRGINQPVRDETTGKVEVTAQNHGFAVDIPRGAPTVAPHGNGKYGRVAVSHTGLNDDVVEGILCLDIPAFSVQYHPEAAAGPHDAAHLFDRLADLVRGRREHKADITGTATLQKES
ncbi:glutamine-hydrolyzing carbamoyl-phosphate synthase small subunit [Devriesea agamarum]|uniref:glutamine-hydrolyzing carbamoyl-phosphate synthase small subunit n=1 Tax=Devriesea agamarum TaxID=472569 RepID=UPI000A0077A2|nr:glutamine-hydrolyzing carbamoyl-phosphate synthase small subunit [Devriesea agamarum]